MESQLAERNNHLQSALTQSYSVQEGIDGLLRWLDVAEKNTNRVVNTPIAAKKEVLLELMQDQKVGFLGGGGRGCGVSWLMVYRDCGVLWFWEERPTKLTCPLKIQTTFNCMFHIFSS